jgi:hypothetical protein
MTDNEIKFPAGKYYACDDPETLTCFEPEEAMEQYLENEVLVLKMSVAEVVAAIRAASITVTAYNPKSPPDSLINSWAESLLVTLDGIFSGEHGSPDGECLDFFPPDAPTIMRAAVKDIIRRSDVWACEPVGSVTLTPDQVESMMRKHCPYWFDAARGDDR